MSDLQMVAAFLSLCIIGIAAAVAMVRGGKATSPSSAAHIFLDLETLGTNQDSPILVVAAYAVDQCGTTLGRGVWRVDPSDAKRYGIADPSTINWWSEQSKIARWEAFERGPRITLQEALDGLESFIKPLADKYGDQCFIWGNAPTFDCSILRYAFSVFGRDVPWEYWQERDVRTVAWVGKQAGHDAKQYTEFKGEPHVALDDARHQARYTIEVLNKLGGR